MLGRHFSQASKNSPHLAFDLILAERHNSFLLVRSYICIAIAFKGVLSYFHVGGGGGGGHPRRRREFPKGFAWALGDAPRIFYFYFEELFNEFCEVFNFKICNRPYFVLPCKCCSPRHIRYNDFNFLSLTKVYGGLHHNVQIHMSGIFFIVGTMYIYIFIFLNRPTL